MANTLYDNAREFFATGQINWVSTSTILKVNLVDTAAYTPNFTLNKWITDIPSGSIVGPTVAMATGATRKAVGGACEGGNITFTSVTGPSIEAIIIWQDTGVAGASPLIAYIDTATGLPISPNGGDIIISWDTGPNKIFKL